MDRYFYSVEDFGDRKEIHISGNVYFNDVDETETNYRIAEWTGLSLSLEKVKELLDDDCFFEYINEQVNYLEYITKEEALEICDTFWEGDSGVELDIRDVTLDTPCGYYWFDGGKQMNEEYASIFVNAIKELASKQENLDNLESYLSNHFDIWMEKFANTPSAIATELKCFAEMEF